MPRNKAQVWGMSNFTDPHPITCMWIALCHYQIGHRLRFTIHVVLDNITKSLSWGPRQKHTWICYGDRSSLSAHPFSGQRLHPTVVSCPNQLKCAHSSAAAPLKCDYQDFLSQLITHEVHNKTSYTGKQQWGMKSHQMYMHAATPEQLTHENQCG